jgi:D-alanyl-D-alanine carboxypeptidase
MKKLFAFLLLLFPILAHAFTDKQRQAICDAVNLVVQQRSIQGASVAIKQANDLVLCTAGFSHQDTAISSDMLFGIGSNTKTMTAVLLLRLQDLKQVQLDMRIGRWIQHPNVDTGITIRQLLNHTSGLGEYSATNAYRSAIMRDAGRIWNSQELLEYIPKAQFEKGTDWSYCNTNYLLAGIIAEKVMGRPLMELYRTHIFDRINMNATVLGGFEQYKLPLAHRWIEGNDLFSISLNSAWTGANAAGAVLSTSYDMITFYQSLFNRGLISNRAMDELLTLTGPEDYGLGISRKTIAGAYTIGHSGAIRGYTSVMLYLPDYNTYIAVLCNDNEAEPVAIAAAIIEQLSNVSSVEDNLSNNTQTSDTNPISTTIYDLQGKCYGRFTSKEVQQYTDALTPGLYILFTGQKAHMFVKE